MITEEEAKTKWCPAFRGNDHGINRPLEMEVGLIGRCLGSACMAWRWSFSPERAAFSAKEAPQTHAQTPFIPRGYCGLAGEAR